MWNVSFKIIFLLLALCGATGAQAQISKKKYYPSSREEYKDYGGKVSVGVSIFGLGIPVRFYATPLHVFEVNAELIGAIIQNNFERGSQLRARACLGASYTFLTDPFFIAKTTRKGVTTVKLKKQGFAFRYNTLFSSKPLRAMSIGYAMESIRENNKKGSFTFELGIRYVPPFILEESRGESRGKAAVGPHLRLAWGGFYGTQKSK
jgi:hypothetical protein